MNTITRRTATFLAAGVLGLGGLAAAAPALAGNGLFAGPGGGGPGYGMGPGYSSCMGLGLGVTAEQGTLTPAQQATLASMAQEEKLAHDLYAAFGARHGSVVLDHIAAAETQHLAAVRTLLGRYGLTDPTANQAAGAFTDAAVQATYERLLAQGEKSLSAALAAGQQVERDDIADLKAALQGLTAPDVEQVYQRLLTASEHHLMAFTMWSHR